MPATKLWADHICSIGERLRLIRAVAISKQTVQQMMALLLFLYALIGGSWINLDLKPFPKNQIVRQRASHPIIIPSQQEKRMMLLSFTPYPEKKEKGGAVGFFRTHVMKKDHHDIIQGMGNLINNLIALLAFASSLNIDLIRAEYKNYEHNNHAGDKFDRHSGFFATELPYFLGQISDQKTKEKLFEILTHEVPYLPNNTGRIGTKGVLDLIENRQAFRLKSGKYLLGRFAHSLWLSQAGVKGVYEHLASYYPPLKTGCKQREKGAPRRVVYHFRCGDLIKEGNKRLIPYPLVLIKAVFQELRQQGNLYGWELLILSQTTQKGVHNKKDAASLELCRFVVQHMKKLLVLYFQQEGLQVDIILQNKSPKEDFVAMVCAFDFIFGDSTFSQMAGLLNLGRKALLLEKGEPQKGNLYGYFRGGQSKISPFKQFAPLSNYITDDQFVEGREIYKEGLGKEGKLNRKAIKRLFFPTIYNRSINSSISAVSL